MLSSSLLLLAVALSAPVLQAQSRPPAPRKAERAPTDKPGWLGVYLETADDQVRISEAVPGSPAAKAGLRGGDRILSVDDEACSSAEDVVQKIGSRKAGTPVKVVIERDQKKESMVVQLGVRPEPDAAAPMAVDETPRRAGGAPPKPPAEPSAKPSAKPSPRSSAQAQGTDKAYLGIGIQYEEASGLEITSVMPDGPAGAAGAKVGDRIVRVGEQKAGDLGALEKVLQTSRPGQKLGLTVMRGDKEVQLSVTLGRRPDSGGAAGPKSGDEAAAEKTKEKAAKAEKEKTAAAEKAEKSAKADKEKAAAAEKEKAARAKADFAGKPDAARTAKTPQKGAVAWGKDLDKALQAAKASGKPVLVKFQAEWCQPCHLLSEVMARPEVAQRVAGFVPVIVDTDEDARVAEPLAEKYGVTGLPHVTVLDASGKQLASFTGNQSAEFVQKFLQQHGKGGDVAKGEPKKTTEPRGKGPGSGPDDEARRAAERAHAEAMRNEEQVRREVERAHAEARRQVEQARREAERATEQARREAMRASAEAHRQAEEARAMAERAHGQGHAGAPPRPASVDAEVRELRAELRRLRELLEQLMEKMDKR